MTTTTHSKAQTTFSAIFQWRSLKEKVTIFTLTIFLISIWSLAFYASSTLHNDMEKTLGEQQFSTVSIIASDINDELEERLKSLEMSAAKITPAILGNAASTQTFLESHISFKRLFNYGCIVMRRDGVAIAEVPNHGRIGINYSDRDFVIEALEGKTTLGKPVMGKRSRSPVLPYATPIRDNQGKVIGVVVGITDMSKPSFLGKITDNSYGKTGGYLLVAPKIRTIVYATDKKRIMEVLPAPGINPLIDSYIQGYEGSGITTRPADGVETLSSAKGIPVAGWYVAALMPTEEAFAPIRAMMWRLLLATIFLTMLVGGLTWWMLKRQLTPVFTTIKVLGTLADTNRLPQPLPITRQDEIGELIGGFNHLLQILGQREVAVRESEERYRNLFENVREAIFVARDGNLVFLNSRTATQIGYSVEELKSKSFIEFIHPDDREMVIENHIKRIKGEEIPNIYSFRIIHRDGSVRWAELNSISINWEGKPATLNFMTDITSRKQAEEFKAKLEAQLQQSQKMEAIGTLAGGIAHDFNNILAVIIGYTELARDRSQKENKEQYLQEILMGTERARNLIKQILTFSRQDDHTEKKPLDIKVLLKEAVKFLRSSIPTTVEINHHTTEEDCNIMADPTQMHQVVMNLCTNAAHAMKEAGGILNIELTTPELGKGDIPNYPDLQPGHYVKLTVSDTGYGIDPAIVQRVFEPFFTTKSVDEGTGLGLSVVYGIVKGHGGAINVYSEQGKGAVFHIYLPRIIQAEAMEVEMDKPVIGGTERILFVDDETALVDIGMRMLSSLGYHTTVAESSIAALDKFHAEPHRFDLVITDMTLPKMTGIDLSRKMLKIRPDIPIILSSGIKDHETEAQATSLGIKAYVIKPLTRRELALAVRDVLDGREKR
jgi:PAS domain S-box-containing protein